MAFLQCSGLALEQPISLDQPVYVPGNETRASGHRPCSKRFTLAKDRTPSRQSPCVASPGKLSLQGDFAVFKIRGLGELQRSYNELPVRLIHQLHAAIRSRTASVGQRDTSSPAEEASQER